MMIEKQKNIIWDIIPPQISRPVIQQKYFFVSFQMVPQYISILLIGLLIFIPLSSVFAEDNQATSTEEILMPNSDISSSSPEAAEEESLVNELATGASTTVQDTPDDPAELAENTEERIIGTSTTEVIDDDSVAESIIEDGDEVEIVENLGEIVEERVMGTSTAEGIDGIIENVIKNSEVTENIDVIVESESKMATSSVAISFEVVKDLQEETEEILISNADISSSNPETVGDSADVTDVSAPANVSDIFGGQVVQVEPQLASEPLNTQDPFAGKECIFLNNGNDFYCFKSNKESNASTSIENPGAIEKGKVSSIRDLDGDREISLYINGKSVQITNNNWDDLFPSQDITGSSIVWQSLINDRWQIMFYDQGMATTTQITDSDFNNMMPQIYGDVIVWQGWPRDNWEIFYAKKNNNGEWVVKQVTNNDYSDMFPKVMGDIITWQAFKNGGWHIFVYDIKGDAITKISATGIKNENPKFMIIWEEKGDGTATRTFGYDFFSGEVVELNNNEKPQEIPEPPLKNDIALSISTTTPNKLEDEESN